MTKDVFIKEMMEYGALEELACSDEERKLYLVEANKLYDNHFKN